MKTGWNDRTPKTKHLVPLGIDAGEVVAKYDAGDGMLFQLVFPGLDRRKRRPRPVASTSDSPLCYSSECQFAGTLKEWPSSEPLYWGTMVGHPNFAVFSKSRNIAEHKP